MIKNSFFKKEHKDIVNYSPRTSSTIQGIETSVSEYLKNGTVESVQEKIRKRMIFGNRIKMEDLTAIDHFRYTITRYNNLTRAVSERDDIKMRVQKQQIELEKASQKAEQGGSV